MANTPFNFGFIILGGRSARSARRWSGCRPGPRAAAACDECRVPPVWRAAITTPGAVPYLSLTTEWTTVPAMCGVCSTHSGSSFYICILSFLPASAYRVHTQVYCMYPVRRAPPPLFPARHHHRGLSTSTLSARRRRHLPAPVVHPVLLSPILPSAPLRPRRRHKRPRLLASPTRTQPAPSPR